MTGRSREDDLRRQLQDTLTRLREVRAAFTTESGELESVRAANEEAAKLQAALERKDYRILHLTRALDAVTSSCPSGDAPDP